MTNVDLPVLVLSKKLAEPPCIQPVDGVSVRSFKGEQDIQTWLDIRASAFADVGDSLRGRSCGAGRSWCREQAAEEKQHLLGKKTVVFLGRQYQGGCCSIR